MRILFVSNLYPPHHIGGYEMACRDVAEELGKRGHESYVLTSTYGVNRQTVEGNVYRRLYLYRTFYTNEYSVVGSKYFEVYNYFIAKDVIGEINPDIVFAWSLNSISLSPAIAAKDLGIKVVYYISDYWPSECK